ncbi:hypothetical protein [Longispora albida]|uniref:hypothetical protein n=1 Tax=Longispora albida TaxID=203523 RepID=UPI000375E8E6|nr:hypothetical protein [Longispora albida]
MFDTLLTGTWRARLDELEFVLVSEAPTWEEIEAVSGCGGPMSTGFVTEPGRLVLMTGIGDLPLSRQEWAAGRSFALPPADPSGRIPIAVRLITGGHGMEVAAGHTSWPAWFGEQLTQALAHGHSATPAPMICTPITPKVYPAEHSPLAPRQARPLTLATRP